MDEGGTTAAVQRYLAQPGRRGGPHAQRHPGGDAQLHGPRSGWPAADVDALGVILYELLTGRPPFRAETAAATIQQVLTEDPVPPTRLNARLPHDLQTICLKCLAKEPRLRYPSAAALAEDLRRFLLGEAVLARPERRWERLVRQARRKPVLYAALATGTQFAGVLAGIALFLTSLKRIQQAHPGDFWANIELGDRLAGREKNPAEAMRYYQAACAAACPRSKSASVVSRQALALGEVVRAWARSPCRQGCEAVLRCFSFPRHHLPSCRQKRTTRDHRVVR